MTIGTIINTFLAIHVLSKWFSVVNFKYILNDMNIIIGVAMYN